MDAWEKFKSFVSESGLVAPGDRVLLAVSGGPDSVCLTHLFWRLKKSMPLGLLIVNLDHGLRKKSSSESAAVKKLGAKLRLPVIVRKIQVRKAAETDKISLETAGRNMRYEALFAIADEDGYSKIATGHTADDNAETVLMWLIRGTGSEGLAGIPAVRKGEKKASIIRPMLPVTRDEVMGYIKKQKLPFSIDSSNLKMDFTRNRIRHKVIPVLKKFNPKFIEHVSNLSGIVSLDNEFMNGIAERALKRISAVSKNGISIDLRRFFQYNEAVKQRILKEILPEKRSLRNIRRLSGLVLSENQTEIILSKLWRVEKMKNRLFFRKTKAKDGL